MQSDQIPSKRLLGLTCHALTASQMHDFARGAVSSRSLTRVLFLNASKVVSARADDRLRGALQRAELVAADGQSIVWAGRLLGAAIPERTPGVEYMEELLRIGNENAWRFFFLGSTEDTLADLTTMCRERFPHLVVAGSHHGFFDEEHDREVAELIRESKADVAFVGMPSPRKEYWIDEYGEAARASMIVAVGGSYEVLTGHVSRAPDLWQKGGLEWAWRLVHEPRRLWRRYLSTNTRFMALVARERILGPNRG
jgi:N-acetylglucosaminyldiphosphoundecaprenol N-acetyl-beta-D-mannosaminyltransferase